MALNADVQHRICLVVPYFGRLPSMFPLWLRSCAHNPDVDWLLMTDDRTAFEYPTNVRVEYTSFDALRGRFASHFPFPIKLENGWGFCAFRPAYGEVFADRFAGYAWWGYCDLDVIFGRLRTFATPDLLDQHDKFLWLGHLAFYRNRPEVNSAFRLKTAAGDILYRRAFECGDVACFDEVGINSILEANAMKVFRPAVFADFAQRSFLFRMLYQPNGVDVSGGRQVFTWEEGRLCRHYLSGGALAQEEMMYIHFCRRPMKVKVQELRSISRFAMVPNEFVGHPGAVSADYILNHTRGRIYWDYWLPRLRPRRVLSKVREMVRKRKVQGRPR